MQLKSITPHLYQLALGSVNCFIIDAGRDGLLLVDTGYKNSTDKIFEAIVQAGKSPSDIRYLLLTHIHPDHAGGAAEISRRTGAKILAHPADAALGRLGISGRFHMS